MKKFTILTLSLILLISLSSFATETRVLTMGENNNILLDEANIFIYPGRIVEYPNLAIGEFGNDEFTNFGINWQFDEDNPWVLGTYFSTMSTFQPNDLKGNNLGTLNLLNNRRATFLYGRTLGAHKAGLSVSYFNSSQEFEDDPGTLLIDEASKDAFKYIDFTVGLTEAEGKWDVAAGLGFGSWTDENNVGTETKADGYYDISLMGRYFMAKGPNYTYIPHAGIGISKHGINEPGITTIDTYKLTTFDVGFGINYTPSNNVLAVMDFGFMLNNWSHENDDGTNPPTEIKENNKVLPYFKLGLDAEVFKWMDIRFGATSEWNNEEDDFDTYKNDRNFASNQTYLGFGFHWGNLTIDTYANPELFLKGFNFISGGVEDMNFQFSTIYEF